ncbi:MAG: DUF4382 domain-containing protein [Nanoarchaeota archaeon]|nr:DUF4382 domain-containing protein [Nanoarchaeota archaeon]
MKKILLALFLIILLFGCVKQPVQETPQPEEVEKPVEEPEQPAEFVSEPITGKGTLKLYVSSEGDIIPDFDSIKVTFNLVKVFDAKSPEFVEQSVDVLADLTELQGTNAFKALELKLDEGDYSKIKLYTKSIKAKLLGNDIEIIIPGGNLLLEKNFKIKKGETTSFVVNLEALKTGKITTTTGLEQYKLQTIQLKSGTVPVDVTLMNELTLAEMMANINEKAGKNYDRHVFLTLKDGFAPSKITIKTGTKVIWENKDALQLGILMSGTIDKMIRSGGTYEYTFNRAGTYTYNMKFHISNAGEITAVLPETVTEEEEAIVLIPKSVDITSTGFNPVEVVAKGGAEVTFTNKDTKYHNLVIGGETLNYNLAPGEVHVHTFKTLGETTFYDGYNVKDYSGKVVIT